MGHYQASAELDDKLTHSSESGVLEQENMYNMKGNKSPGPEKETAGL